MEEEKLQTFPTVQQLEVELKRRRYRSGYFRLLRSTVSSLLVVAAIAVLISMLFLPVLRVTGTSMTPTLQNDELVVCSKRSNFECGDVVAFYYNNKILLKRVIGLPGDIIDLQEDGTVYVNGEPLEEPYLSEKAFGECDIDLPYQVPDNRIFCDGGSPVDFGRQPFDNGWLYRGGVCDRKSDLSDLADRSDRHIALRTEMGLKKGYKGGANYGYESQGRIVSHKA